MYQLIGEVGKVLDRLYKVIEFLMSQLGLSEELWKFPSYHLPCSRIETKSINNDLNDQDNETNDVNIIGEIKFEGTEIILPETIEISVPGNKCLNFFCKCTH